MFYKNLLLTSCVFVVKQAPAQQVEASAHPAVVPGGTGAAASGGQLWSNITSGTRQHG